MAGGVDPRASLAWCAAAGCGAALGEGETSRGERRATRRWGFGHGGGYGEGGVFWGGERRALFLDGSFGGGFVVHAAHEAKKDESAIRILRLPGSVGSQVWRSSRLSSD